MMTKILSKVNITGAMLLIASASAFAQEYIYDPNGNLNGDNNKQISSIHHNYLNLVDTIIYADARKMIYTYTATGQKLREQSVNADGTSLKKRDYDLQILFAGDVLQEIQHEEGRLVPITPGSSSSPFDYQYHLNDHLGNVRSIVTSNPGTTSNIAAFETSSVNDEQNNFTDYDKARRINSMLFDHTKTGTSHYSQKLNGSANEKQGIAKSLSVMPGDTVRLEVYAKYVDPNKNNLSAALTTMLSQIAMGTASVGTVIDGAGYAGSGNTPFPFTGLNGVSEIGGSGPKAYLNWLMFDHNFVFKTGGHVRMSEAGKENGSNVKHEKLEKQLVITQPGYVYVYLSNEETTPVDVYFDDFSVTQANGPVTQRTDYDPFGLTFNEYLRENAAPNDFLYNGKELQKDFDLNWYDYGARMYDVALGRWHVIDPMAEKYSNWSPYNYVGNNPVNFVDPDGREIASASRDEWDKQKKEVTDRLNRTKEQIAVLDAMSKQAGWNKADLANLRGSLSQTASSLSETVNTIGNLEKSKQVYSLKSGDKDFGDTSYDPRTGNIVITSGTTANFIHEITHAGQFESGDVAFDSKTGGPVAVDLGDEVAAYKAQFAYDPSSVSDIPSTSKATTPESITTSWVQGIRIKDNAPYDATSHAGLVSISINSPAEQLRKAYPKLSIPSSYTIKKDHTNLHYKK